MYIVTYLLANSLVSDRGMKVSCTIVGYIRRLVVYAANVFLLINEIERPRQWHNKGASSTRAQAVSPPAIPR
jgi:hypothetical protein